MDREDEKKYTLDTFTWCIINNLTKFDKTPELLEASCDKIFSQLSDHPILSKFVEIFKTAFEYYEDHNSFPTIQWLEINYSRTGNLQRRDDEFTMQLYEDWNKRLDAEVIKTKCSKLVTSVKLDPDELRTLMKLSSDYCDNAEGQPKTTKSSLINLYDDYSKEYKGVTTGMQRLDDAIGVMGYKSITVFGAPSGHGKTSWAVSVAYNAAMQGLCVDYVSYEVSRDNIWFSLVAMESYFQGGMILETADMRENKLNEEQQEYFKVIMNTLLTKFKEAGGFINVVDRTTAPAGTYEEFKLQLEKIATEREDSSTGDKFDRKADLVIVDNVDNFQVFKSKERDESTRVNNYIIDLDSFCKTYHNGDGCAIILLTQLNRGGLKRLASAEELEDAKMKSSKIDYTVFSKFNALYEKATCCLVGFADASTRLRGKMNIYPVKIRNRAVPEEPIEVAANYAVSRIGGLLGGNQDPPKSQNSDIRDVQAALENYEEYSIDDLDDDGILG